MDSFLALLREISSSQIHHLSSLLEFGFLQSYPIQGAMSSDVFLLAAPKVSIVLGKTTQKAQQTRPLLTANHPPAVAPFQKDVESPVVSDSLTVLSILSSVWD